MIAIVKYNAGNIRSVENALQRLGCQVIITDDEHLLRQADKVIFPGVGEASSAMANLRANGLDKIIPTLTQPVLGICVGLQLLCKHSEEGNTDCLGIFDTLVKRFPPKEKVPHIGWNNFAESKGSLFQNIDNQQDVYFVHSYYAAICQETTATCDYILPFSAALQKDNFYAVQFHVEKSATVGETILKNFLIL